MYYIKINNKIKESMIHHTQKDPKRECGGFLYGNYYLLNGDIYCDINSLYYENLFGKEAEFQFGITYITRALQVEKQINNGDILMGTYHSHGQYPAIFSEVDRNELQKYFGKNKITMIYSPKYSQLIGEFLDEYDMSHKAKILTKSR